MPAMAMSRPTDAILERLKSLHPKVIDLALDRVLDLLGEQWQAYIEESGIPPEDGTEADPLRRPEGGPKPRP